MNEILALEKNLPFFVEKQGRKYHLFIKCSDYCGNSFSGEFDYHWTYNSYTEAKEDGIKITT